MAQDRKSIGYVIDRARDFLNDRIEGAGGSLVWDNSKLIGYLNLAQREICSVRPDAHAETIDVGLVKGSLQQLPSRAKSLVDVVCNVDADGVEGNAVVLVRREDLDRTKRGWRSKPQMPLVRSFAYDERNPEYYDVNPPNDGTGRLRLECYTIPPDIGNERGTEEDISLSDEYLNPMIYWICRMAYSEESTGPEYLRRSDEFRLMFYDTLGIQATNKLNTVPEASAEEVGVDVDLVNTNRQNQRQRQQQRQQQM